MVFRQDNFYVSRFVWVSYKHLHVKSENRIKLVGTKMNNRVAQELRISRINSFYPNKRAWAWLITEKRTLIVIWWEIYSQVSNIMNFTFDQVFWMLGKQISFPRTEHKRKKKQPNLFELSFSKDILRTVYIIIRKLSNKNEMVKRNLLHLFIPLPEKSGEGDL